MFNIGEWVSWISNVRVNCALLLINKLKTQWIDFLFAFERRSDCWLIGAIEHMGPQMAGCVELHHAYTFSRLSLMRVLCKIIAI